MYRLFDDEIASFIRHRIIIIRCRMHRIFVRNRPLQIKVNWLRLFQCDWSNIRDRVDRRSIKAPFVLFLQLDVKDKRVTGVRFLQNGKEQCVEVKKEAVVCGGAVQSPQVSGSGYFLILNFGLWEFHIFFFLNCRPFLGHMSWLWEASIIYLCSSLSMCLFLLSKPSCSCGHFVLFWMTFYWSTRWNL